MSEGPTEKEMLATILDYIGDLHTRVRHIELLTGQLALKAKNPQAEIVLVDPLKHSEKAAQEFVSDIERRLPGAVVHLPSRLSRRD